MISRLRAVIALMRNPKVGRFPKFMVVAAILYLLDPFDLVPDAAPLIGWLDDLTFLIGALSFLLAAKPKADPKADPKASPHGAIIDVVPEPPSGKRP